MVEPKIAKGRNLTALEIATNFTKMKESISLVNEAIATNDKDEETLACVKRNIDHLEHMLTRDYWTTEDMSDVNAAITAGKAYIA